VSASSKTIAIVYERGKPSGKIDEGWFSRCRSRQHGDLAALEQLDLCHPGPPPADAT